MPNPLVQPRKITAKNSNSEWSKSQVAEQQNVASLFYSQTMKMHEFDSSQGGGALHPIFFDLECDSLDQSKVRRCVYRLSGEKSLNVTYHAHKGGNELVDIALWREHRGRHTNAGPRCHTIAVNYENIEIAQ